MKGSAFISSKELLINDQIHEKEIRVVSADNEQLGVMSSNEALKLAEKENLDLVLIAPQGNPPVCRIMDYGKFRFEQAKREKDAKKNQKQIEIKEIRLSLNIDTNDFNTKLNQAIKFLKSGDKVKVNIRFKGREMTHVRLGEELMGKFKEACYEFGAAEKPSKLEGRNYALILSPKVAAPVKKQKANQEQDNQ